MVDKESTFEGNVVDVMASKNLLKHSGNKRNTSGRYPSTFKSHVATIMARKNHLKHFGYKNPWTEDGTNEYLSKTNCYRWHVFGESNSLVPVREMDPEWGMGAILRNIPVGRAVQSISCSQSWAAILVLDDQVFTWGSNSYGQLGQGEKGGYWPYPTHVQALQKKGIVSFSCGTSHGGFISNTGALYMTGCGAYGRLGTGSDKDVHRPTRIFISVNQKFSESSTMKGILEEESKVKSKWEYTRRFMRVQKIQNLADFVKFKFISCGDRHSLALSSDSKKFCPGSLFAFGDGGQGRLGVGDDEDRMQPELITRFRSAHGILRPNLSYVHAGNNTSAAVSKYGMLFTWGSGSCGALGHGGNERELIPRRVETLCCHKVVSVSMGEHHMLAVDVGGQLFASGSGYEGQRGIGKTDDVTIPRKIAFSDKTVRITKVAAGSHHSACIDRMGKVYTWGCNEFGKLGNQKERTNMVPCMVECITQPDYCTTSNDNPKKHSAVPREVLFVGCTENVTAVLSFCVEDEEDCEEVDGKAKTTEVNTPTIGADVTPSNKKWFLDQMSNYNIAISNEAKEEERKKSWKWRGGLAKLRALKGISNNKIDLNEKDNMKKNSRAKVYRKTNWIQRHAPHQALARPRHSIFPNPPRAKFSVAPRFKPVLNVKTDKVKEHEIVHAKKALPPSFSRSMRPSLCLSSESPGPAAYLPKRPASRSTCIYRPKSTMRIRKIVAPTVKKKELEPRRGTCRDDLIFPRVSGPLIGDRTNNFSLIIGRRLRSAQGAGPDPGSYFKSNS